MQLIAVDWAFVIGFFVVSLGIGIYTARQAGRNSTEFFLSGRNMPWWLLGVSMVATTFSLSLTSFAKTAFRETGSGGRFFLPVC